MAKVTVYYFKVFDIIAGDMVESRGMATLEYIKRIDKGSEPILETAKVVDSSEVDADGRYPKKTSS